MLARNYKEGVHPSALDNIGGFQQGQVAIYDVPATLSNDFQCKLPTGAQPWLSAPVGIVDSAGFVGGSGSVLGESLSIGRQGMWRALLSANQTVTRGQEFIADAGTLGNVIPRTPYSFSAYVLGVSEEAYGPSSTADLFECYLQPMLKEIIRTIFGSFSTAPGAATKFFSAPGTTTGASSAVALCVVPFANCVLRNLVATATTAPGGSDTGVITVQRNPFSAGAYGGFADTTLTCTITGTGLSASDLTHSVVCNQFDLVAIKCVSSNTTLAGLNVQVDLT